MMHRPDSTPLLAQVSVPTLVITGEEDEMIPVEESRRIASGIRGAKLVIIPGAGHLANLEQPDAFNDALQRVSYRTIDMKVRVLDPAGRARRDAALRRSAAQLRTPPADVDALHRPYDEILDVYVRDGLVYYFALKQERAKFDRYVQSLGEVTPDTLKGWSPDRQLAYWINAYNAFVLRTVIDGYPIRGKSPDYPPNSIRQIPGAFERRQFRAAGRMLTLDAIEKDVIGEFDDARALLALGRGAVGGPRLKSEAYTRRAARFAAADDDERAGDEPRPGVRRHRQRAAVGESDVLVARADLHEVAVESRARGLREPQPARAQRAGADRSAAGAERSGVPPQEHISHGVPRLRLETQRSHGALVRWILDLAGKVAIVTGSSRGLGLAAAHALIAEGAQRAGLRAR